MMETIDAEENLKSCEGWEFAIGMEGYTLVAGGLGRSIMCFFICSRTPAGHLVHILILHSAPKTIRMIVA